MGEADLRRHARRYLQALEEGVVGPELAAFFTDDAVQEEFPNALTPRGARRDLDALLEGAKRGRRVMRSQRYEVLSMLCSGETVAIEIAWSGVLDISLGDRAPGEQLRARLAVFLDYRDGRIARQRNYDCFYGG